MFSRSKTSRATVARGSAVEMELRRGRLRLSVFDDSPEDYDVQKQIEREVRVREGACKLLAACSQRDQALQTSKSLLTCNRRIMALMSQLQRLKEAQALQRAGRRSSDGGSLDETLPCTGKVAISGIRIPLMWKDSEYFKNKGELHRCAVFCLLHLGREIRDTDLVMVDRTLTDICFDDIIIFNEAAPDFELRFELYSCGVHEESSLGYSPRRLSRLSGSVGGSSGKKVRVSLDSTPGCGSPSNGIGTAGVERGGGSPVLPPALSVQGPKYHLLAHSSLNLSHVQSSFRTHDLTVSATEDCPYWLPLYGSMCCHLVAQPVCMTQQAMSGRLRIQVRDDAQSWRDVYGVLRGTNLICYHKQEHAEALKEPAFTIAVNKDTRIRATERNPVLHTQSISITNQSGEEEVSHTLVTLTSDDTRCWMEAFWQHFYDMSQWKQCCDELMKIDMPSPRKPLPVSLKQGSLYHEMVTPSTSLSGDSLLNSTSISAEVPSMLSSYFNESY
ncbi:rhotekin [Chanos chanos]|uniref:Rhotekin n=1 Tax=Chanos chanos TaxID=29144 RepID=A0A6J2UZW5_CHACN|nr:rhotekin-like [Chanos chanos]